MPRTIIKTRGIVLRTMRMGETSRLVTLYTEDYGKLKVTAKGARKPKSKFGAAAAGDTATWHISPGVAPLPDTFSGYDATSVKTRLV